MIGRYEVVRTLGKGGMAEVFLCTLGGIGGFKKYVVVKRIRPSKMDDEQFVSCFLDEARLVAGMRHPNIAAVSEISDDEESPHIVMEYVEGPPLGTLGRVARKRRLHDYGVWGRVIADVARGLHHAHELKNHDGKLLKLVHRDVSTDNILVSVSGYAKLIDFGIAKAEGRISATQMGMLKGKLQYMAPEVLRDQDYDARADVFSLGVVLYRMTTGHHAFRGNSQAEVYQARKRGDFLRPTEIDPNFPLDLQRIVLRAMATDPAERFQTAKEMAEALETYLETRKDTGTHDAVGAFVRATYPSYDGDPEFWGQNLTEDFTSLSSLATGPHKQVAPSGAQDSQSPLLLMIGFSLFGLSLLVASLVTVVAAAVLTKRTGPPDDAPVAVLIEEAERLLDEGELATAETLLGNVAEREALSVDETLRIAELEGRLHLVDQRITARRALEDEEWTAALEAAYEVLKRLPDDPETLKIASEAKAALEAAEQDDTDAGTDQTDEEATSAAAAPEADSASRVPPSEPVARDPVQAKPAPPPHPQVEAPPPEPTDEEKKKGRLFRGKK